METRHAEQERKDEAAAVAVAAGSGAGSGEEAPLLVPLWKQRRRAMREELVER